MPSLRWRMSKSDTTMSTSEREKGLPHFSVEEFRTVLPPERQVIPVGFPDPEVLASMANDFFTALPLAPGTSSELALLTGAAGTGESSAAMPAPAAPSATSIPTETQLRALPPTLPITGSQAQIPAIPGAFLPEIPGGVNTSRFGGPTSLSFLEEIRPLFSYAAFSLPGIAVIPEAIKIPAETELRPFANSFSAAAVPQTPEFFTSRSAPQVAGATAQPAAWELPLGYSFLNEIRQLSPNPANLPSEIPFSAPDDSTAIRLSSEPFDAAGLRRDFPILQQRVNGKQLIWLDNAATTQKPQSVIDRLSHYYAHENSNIHRAAHELAARATDAYEAAREKVRRFLNASTVREIIFVRGATEGINLVAQSWGRQNVQKDDEIVITWLEHHANIVPWQMLCSEKGARLRVVPVDSTGQVILEEYEKLLNPRTKLVSIAHVSNALGTILPVAQMTETAHRHGAR